jgi:histidine triad (HIT) family protein
MEDCLFCKIIRKEIPSYEIYEDNHVYAFLDIRPVHPGHVLVVPKMHSKGFRDAKPDDLKYVVFAAQKIAEAVMEALKTPAFNLELNDGEVAGQIVPHTHLHVIPRYENDGLKHWPGKDLDKAKGEELARQIREALVEPE